jgi:hypothetical protein
MKGGRPLASFANNVDGANALAIPEITALVVAVAVVVVAAAAV